MTSLAQESKSNGRETPQPDSARNQLDERYSRQILFRGIGAEGQQKLSAARVAIVGCGATGSALPLLQGVQTFPVAYQSPVARISVVIRDNLRWNFGYQYYGYRQQFEPGLNFRANTGYSSLSFSF